MKRILLTLSYDGTAYHGWQIQPNAITVQETVQDALFKLLGSPHGVTGCSRTDAGVHAREFCCHIDCGDNIPDAAFLRGLNSLLPSDIAVKDIKEVAPDFHARYNAKGKTYKYRILNSSIKDPFLSRYFWQIERKLNVDKMNEFCEKIVGTHDFYAFSSSGRTVEDTKRTVTQCSVTEKENRIFFEVAADGFLYNMVRILAGTALAVGYGRLAPDCALDIFKTQDRSLGGDTLAAHGLILKEVYY